MKPSAKNTKRRTANRPLYLGCPWGEPLDDKGSLTVRRVCWELEVSGAMPDLNSEAHRFDLVLQYSNTRQARPTGTERTGKDGPHVRFANANDDDKLIEFVRSFGPVVCKSFRRLRAMNSEDKETIYDERPIRILQRARQDLKELKSEQQIYKAALNLILELAKEESEYVPKSANQWIAEIACGISNWPLQWRREKKQRGESPLWRAPRESIQRITVIGNTGRDLILPPQVDARIVLCELLNIFPSLAFPNRLEMYSYIQFGIRPLLYGILRREFLQPRDVSVCANTQCREFFEVERAGQRFCDDDCSRRQRQREYWQVRGKTARRERLAAPKQRS